MRSSSLLASLCLVASCGGSASSTSGPTTTIPTETNPTLTTSVNISGTAFGPRAIQVSPGAVVTWTNSDNFNHNVTFSDGSIGAIPDYSSGAMTLTMPTTPGTYAYRCTIHAGMTATVLVK